ncbi:hypothetical protein HK097_010944, partial [Rhizophlyctis rosea]
MITDETPTRTAKKKAKSPAIPSIDDSPMSPSRFASMRANRASMDSREYHNAKLISLQTENEELKSRLMEKDQDCTLAATVGQSLLQEIEALKGRLRDLEEAKTILPGTPEQPHSHIRLIETEVDTLSSSLKGLIGKLSPTTTPELPRASTTRRTTFDAQRTITDLAGMVGDAPRSRSTFALNIPKPAAPTRLKKQNTIRGSKRSSEGLVGGFNADLATELDGSLLQHARSLQHRLAQAEAGRAEERERIGTLEKTLEGLQRQHEKVLSKRAKSDEKIWDLEIQTQQLRDQLTLRETDISRLQTTIRHMEEFSKGAVEQVEALKGQEQQMTESSEHMKARFEAELTKYRKTVAVLQRENTDLSKQYEDLLEEVEARKLGRRSAAIWVDTNGKPEVSDLASISEFSQRYFTPDTSPSKSMKSFRSNVFVESLSASLRMAQERIVELEEENGRVRGEGEELGKLLAQAQEMIEGLRGEVGGGASMGSDGLQEKLRDRLSVGG